MEHFYTIRYEIFIQNYLVLIKMKLFWIEIWCASRFSLDKSSLLLTKLIHLLMYRLLNVFFCFSLIFYFYVNLILVICFTFGKIFKPATEFTKKLFRYITCRFKIDSWAWSLNHWVLPLPVLPIKTRIFKS